MIVCFSGWRGWTDRAFIEKMVFDLLRDIGPEQVRVGDCPTGVDWQVTQELNRMDVLFERYRADWDQLGKNAGPLRNWEMLTGNGESLADLLVALPEPGSHPGQKVSGTWTCIGQAYEIGVDVFIPKYTKERK